MPPLMIKFKCPKCQSRFKTPDGKMGKQVTCPQCHKPFRIGLTPDLKQALWHARILEARKLAQGETGQHVSLAPGTQQGHATEAASKAGLSAYEWVQAHNRIALITGIILAPCLIIAGWLYYQSSGRLPLRPKAEDILKDGGYHRIGAIPSMGILRGRSLWKFQYALDANHPQTTGMQIWCALEDKNATKAITAHWSKLPYGTEQAWWHKTVAENIIADISGIVPRKQELSLRGNGSYCGVYRKRGYVLEMIGAHGYGKDKNKLVRMTYILRDKKWDR